MNLPEPPHWTERLTLRPHIEEDASIAYEALDCAPGVWTFDQGYQRMRDERCAVIRRFAMLHRQFGFGPCAAVQAGAGAPIGQGGLNPYLFAHRDGTQTVEFEVMFKIARPFKLGCRIQPDWLEPDTVVAWLQPARGPEGEDGS